MPDATTPMHLLVAAYPAPDDFGHAVLHRYVETVGKRGQTAVVRDLYALGFDPVLKPEERPTSAHWMPAGDVAAELGFVDRAAILVLVYPIWYGLPPAILKGYVDRVLGAGYSFRHMHDRTGQAGLRGKPLLSISTSGLSHGWLDDQGQILALREIFDVYLWRGFGMRQSEHVMLDDVVPGMCAADAARRLDRVGQAADRACDLLADLPDRSVVEA